MALLADPVKWEYVTVSSSRLHGRGLFAARDFAKGQRIMEYRGTKVTKAEGERRTERQWARRRVYVFTLNKRFDLDGSPAWNLARLANHSCEPNCESQDDRGRRIWIVAKKAIKAGDELTYDYHFDFVDPPPQCLCGAPLCRGYIVGPHHTRRLKAWIVRQGLPLPAGLQPKPAKRAR